MICIGIDPGRQGAVAVVRDREILLLADLPYRGSEVDVDGLCCYIERSWAFLASPDLVCVEAQAPSRAAKGGLGKGGRTMLVNFGAIKGCLGGMGFKVHTPMPRTWQAKILKGIPGVGKERSLFWARRTYPDAELTGPRGGLKDGRADALAIAEYARIVGVGR